MGKFRIKVVSWWASDDYVQLKYSTNGIIWRKVNSCTREILNNRYYMRPLTISYKDAERTVAKFQSIDDIRKYEQDEKDKLMKYNAEIDAHNKRKKAEKEAVYKKFK